MRFVLRLGLILLLTTTQLSGQNVLGQGGKCQLIVATDKISQKPLQNAKILIKRSPSSTLIKSTLLIGTKTTITLNTQEPFYAHAELILGDSLSATTSSFIVTNTSIKIDFQPMDKASKVSGGENEFYYNNRFLYFALPHKLVQAGFNTALTKRSYELSIPANKRLELYCKEYENHVLMEVKKNKNLFFVLDRLNEAKENLSTKTLEDCIANLSDTLQRLPLGVSLKEYIVNSKKLFDGEILPSFSAIDTSGIVISPVILQRNKFSLIDFWASWCVPCRKQMKELRNLHQVSVDTSKLEIISISLDTDLNKWRTASGIDNVVWKNYCDTLGFKGNIAKLFTIQDIPRNIIVDSNGVIVARDIWGEELATFLNKKNLLRQKR